jgi:hypothetical protein
MNDINDMDDVNDNNGPPRDWRDVLYERVMEEETRGLLFRSKHDAIFTIADLKGLLDSLYRTQGDDWLGRGEVGSITIDATIAAYEKFIAQWNRLLQEDAACVG